MVKSIALFKRCYCYGDVNEFGELTDIELIKKIREGDVDAEKYLFVKYSFLVRTMVSSFFIIGADKDDLFQDAMIGFISAVKHFNFNINNNFKAFAEICVRRQIISSIRKTKSYQLLNSMTVYEIVNSEYEEDLIYKLAGNDDIIPENVLIHEEDMNNYRKITSEILSKFEKEVLNEYSLGKTYEEISLTLKKDSKSIDNAIQRIKKKICENKEKLFYGELK